VTGSALRACGGTGWRKRCVLQTGSRRALQRGRRCRQDSGTEHGCLYLRLSLERRTARPLRCSLHLQDIFVRGMAPKCWAVGRWRTLRRHGETARTYRGACLSAQHTFRCHTANCARSDSPAVLPLPQASWRNSGCFLFSITNQDICCHNANYDAKSMGNIAASAAMACAAAFCAAAYAAVAYVSCGMSAISARTRLRLLLSAWRRRNIGWRSAIPVHAPERRKP
jgi:hypothetical protein